MWTRKSSRSFMDAEERLEESYNNWDVPEKINRPYLVVNNEFSIRWSYDDLHPKTQELVENLTDKEYLVSMWGTGGEVSSRLEIIEAHLGMAYKGPVNISPLFAEEMPHQRVFNMMGHAPIDPDSVFCLVKVYGNPWDGREVKEERGRPIKFLLSAIDVDFKVSDNLTKYALLER